MPTFQELEEKILDLENKVSDLKLEVGELKSEVRSQRQEINLLEDELEDAEKELDKCTQDKTKCRKLLNKANDDLRDAATDRYNALVTARDSLRKECEEKNRQPKQPMKTLVSEALQGVPKNDEDEIQFAVRFAALLAVYAAQKVITDILGIPQQKTDQRKWIQKLRGLRRALRKFFNN